MFPKTLRKLDNPCRKFAKPPFANGGVQIRLGRSLAFLGGESCTKRASVILHRPKTLKS